MKTLFWRIQAWFFYGFTWLIAVVPDQLVFRLGAMVGMLMWYLLPGRRRIAIGNIAGTLAYMQTQPGWRCPDDAAAGIARSAFRNIGRSLVETCRLYHNKSTELLKQIEVRGREHYDAAHAAGKGLVFLTGHCGNWEIMALSCSFWLGETAAVVARRQNNPYLNQMVEKMRMQFNNRVIYKENALKNMMSVFRKNGIVGLLVDQAVMPHEGCLIEFLGKKAWASKTPVLLARKTGVAIVPVFAHREGERHVVELHPPIQFTGDSSEEGLAADVKLYSRAIEQFIIEHPTDWYWVHRRWKRAEGL
jgi:Kdo2-lipid IVA lauroyltransferase/acyltransferase